MTFDQQIIAIAMVILGTVITRLVPFILFSSKEKTPAYILYLVFFSFLGGWYVVKME